MTPIVETLRERVQRAWLVLVVATGVAVGLRAEELPGSAIGVATLALAYVKARLVILDSAKRSRLCARRAATVKRGRIRRRNSHARTRRPSIATS
jgi:hypothetical protein